MGDEKVKVGIGFVTGRKNFKNVVEAYFKNWKSEKGAKKTEYSFYLFIAYDLKYQQTKASDYKIEDPEILEKVEDVFYLEKNAVKEETRYLRENNVFTKKESSLIFGDGYGMKRNLILYFALKNKMDYLIFLDDDEYPLVMIKVKGSVYWQSQNVLGEHIKNLKKCDMTHGYHCGYISPIPYLEFNGKLSEEEFKIFIGSISNDIITWKSIQEKMNNGGVTYGDLDIIRDKSAVYVEEIKGMKFISGANLGFNLKNRDKVFPFYNPPGARGEDAFLSTCLGGSVIRKIPIYTFHDGFSIYESLLGGLLPAALTHSRITLKGIPKRFLKAAIGWIRYKPLLLYITKNETYEEEIQKMRKDLALITPKLSNYFGDEEFKDMIDELEYYHAHVKEHYEDFQKTKIVWINILSFLKRTKETEDENKGLKNN